MEIEIKLAPVSAEAAQQLFADPCLTPHLGAAEHIVMRTVYYDLPGRTLAARRYMLRLRQENETCLCTFKAPAQDGRLELECAAETIESGVAGLLRDPALPADAAQLLQSGDVQPVCSAAFTRRQALYDDGALAFMLSYDAGLLENGGRCAPIAEVELELVRGTLPALQAAADRIMEVYGLTEERRSKQQRAFALGEAQA